jgi:hypothetical protein
MRDAVASQGINIFSYRKSSGTISVQCAECDPEINKSQMPPKKRASAAAAAAAPEEDVSMADASPPAGAHQPEYDMVTDDPRIRIVSITAYRRY